MSANVVFKISGGKTTFLVSEHTKAFIPATAVPRRASYIEPMNPWLRFLFRFLRAWCGDEGEVAEFTRGWTCAWQADMTPVGGPIVYNFQSRAAAIEYEIAWLNRNFLNV